MSTEYRHLSPKFTNAVQTLDKHLKSLEMAGHTNETVKTVLTGLYQLYPELNPAATAPNPTASFSGNAQFGETYNTASEPKASESTGNLNKPREAVSTALSELIVGLKQIGYGIEIKPL